MARIDRLVEQWRVMGPAAWAEHTLGWLMEDGMAIRLTDWQRAVCEAWQEHRETTSQLAVSNCKKTGKTTLDAILLCWRWLALPGQHFVCANDLDQSTGLQFRMVAKMVERHPFLSRHVTSTRTRLIFEPTGSELEALSVDAAGSAGANHLTSSHTEAWGVQYEAGIRAWEELTPQPGEFYGLPALRIVDSYAGWLGESTTWHELVERGLAGERVSEEWPIFRAGGLLLFHMEGEEAQERCFRGSARARDAYYEDQRSSLRPAAFDRMHLNLRTASVGHFLPPGVWQSLVDPEHSPLPPGSRQPVWVGLDLATKPGGDDAALAGVYGERGPDGELAVKVAFHQVWKGGRARRQDLRLSETVEPMIKLLAEAYNLRGVWFDPYQALQLAENLRKAGIRCHEVPQSHASRGPRDTWLWELAVNGELVLYDDPELVGAADFAGAKELGNGQLFLEKGGRGKIDLLVALSNALDVEGKFKPRVYFW